MKVEPVILCENFNVYDVIYMTKNKKKTEEQKLFRIIRPRCPENGELIERSECTRCEYLKKMDIKVNATEHIENIVCGYSEDKDED